MVWCLGCRFGFLVLTSLFRPHDPGSGLSARVSGLRLTDLGFIRVQGLDLGLKV